MPEPGSDHFVAWTARLNELSANVLEEDAAYEAEQKRLAAKAAASKPGPSGPSRMNAQDVHEWLSMTRAVVKLDGNAASGSWKLVNGEIILGVGVAGLGWTLGTIHQ